VIELPVLPPASPLPSNNYTFFIIPFTYSLRKADRRNKTTSGRIFCADSPSDGGFAASHLSAIDGPTADAATILRHRLNYLLPETRLTLFKRARWFRLRDELKGQQDDEFEATFSYDTDGESESCRLVANVELVLFEWPLNESGRGRAAIAAPHAVGFLLFAGRIAPQQGASRARSSLDHLFNCNERLRYLTEPPYPGVASTIAEPPTAAPALPRDLWTRYLEAPLDAGQGRHYRLSFPDPPLLERGASGILPGDNDAAFARSYPDGRAFVYTFAYIEGPDQPVDLTPKGSETHDGRCWQRAWFNLLDVDGSSSLRQSKALTQYERDWLCRQTYARWRENGTLYGFTDFSAAQLMQAGRGFYLTYYHYRQMYLDQLLLLFYERMTLFQFSVAISAFSHDSIERNTRDAARRFSKLRQQFMFMTNLYQFPMFTTQQQGLEMYAMARASLSIAELYGELSTEIHATDAYFAQQRDNTRNDHLARIQYIGAAVAFGALTLTGMQVLEVQDTQWTSPTNVILTITAALHHPVDLPVVRAVVSSVIALSFIGLIVALLLALWRYAQWIRDRG